MEIRKLDRNRRHKQKASEESPAPKEKAAPTLEKISPHKKMKRKKLPPKKKILYLILLLVVVGEAVLYNYSSIKKVQSIPPVPPEIQAAEITAHFYGLCMDIIQHENLNGSYPDAIDDMTEAPGFTYSTEPEGVAFLLTYDDGDMSLSYNSTTDFEAVFNGGETE